MGIYTEIIVGCTLIKDIDPKVLGVLQWMLGERVNEPEPENLPDHPFFKCFRWKMLTCCSSSYFGAPTHRSIERDSQEFYRISFRASLKNYDNEIEHFMDWIEPYVDSGSGTRDMYGISIHEDGEPVLYFKYDK